jgi:rod shape-determining protein MreD
MAKKIIIFMFLFLLVILQVSVLSIFFNSRRIPDLVLVVLIFFTMRRGFGEVWKMAVVAGLLVDLFSFFPVGVDIFSFTLVALVTNFLVRRFFVTHPTWKFFILFALIFIGTVVNDVTVSILMKVFLSAEKIENTGFPIFSADLWLKILDNLLLLVLIYWPLKKIEGLRNSQELIVQRLR